MHKRKIFHYWKNKKKTASAQLCLILQSISDSKPPLVVLEMKLSYSISVGPELKVSDVKYSGWACLPLTRAAVPIPLLPFAKSVQPPPLLPASSGWWLNPDLSFWSYDFLIAGFFRESYCKLPELGTQYFLDFLKIENTYFFKTTTL